MLSKMKITTFLFIIIWISSSSAYSQTSTLELREEVQAIVDSIALENVLMGGGIGYAAIEPEQYRRFEKLKEKSSKSDLINLVNHKNAVVRCYAFWALVDQEIPVFDIVKSHLDDREYVSTFFGCIRSGTSVGDFFLDFADLSESQQIEIDSILLNKKGSHLYATKKLLLRIQPIEKNYDRIREIATETKSPYSWIALSKYQNQQDIPLIRELLESKEDEYWGLRCIQHFPHKDFFPYLENWYRSNLKNRKYDYSKIRVFYKALVRYKTENATKLLMNSVKKLKGFRKSTHHKYIAIALTKYPNDYFKEICSNLESEKVDLLDRMEIEID